MVTRKQQKKAASEAEENEYVIVNLTLLNNFVNENLLKHKSTSPECSNPDFKLIKTNSRFISIEIKAQCKNCKYVSENAKMYYKMDKTLQSLGETDSGDGGSNRGDKASTLNASLAAALTNTMIGVTQLRRLFLEIGIDVGASSTLQKLCSNMTNLNKRLAASSMEKGINELKLQTDRGKATAVTQDGYYNNRQRRGPCQAGTQVVYTSVGSNGKILAFNTFNKLCPKGKRLESKNLGSCDEGHPGCVRTLDEVAPISQEGRMALDALFSLREKGYVPDYLTVDGDTQIRDKVAQFSKDIDKHILVQYDVNHWVKNLEKYLNKHMPFDDDGTFNGGKHKDNKRMRQSTMRKLCLDISNRCKAEIKLCSELTENITDSGKRIDEMYDTFTEQLKLAILKCLQGQCGELCEKHSLFCYGEGKEKSRQNMIGDHIELKGENLSIAEERINAYFEKERIADVFLQLNTNINEALHRGYQRTNPKITTYAKNYVGRVCREIIHYNEGIAVSAQLVNDAIGHKTCSNVKNKLKKEQQGQEYQTAYSKLKSTKKRRFQRLSSTYQKHTKYRRAQKNTKSTYKKGIDFNK